MKRLGIAALAVAGIMLILSLTAYATLLTAARSLDVQGVAPAVVDRSVSPGTTGTTTGTTQQTSALAEAQATGSSSLTAAQSADVETQIYETVYREVNPAVVYIENQAQARMRGGGTTLIPQSSGSGFVWDAQGHIVTNNHVVEGADHLQVTFSDGITVDAELVGTDSGSDLAVIKVDPSLRELTPVVPGDIAGVRVGARAIAIGNPYGLVGTMTTGIISAVGRTIASNPNDPTSYNIPQVIQTDAAINPGNSGGPLLDERGHVIGVNFQITSSTSGSNSGVGFAIPVNIVERVVPALVKTGSYRHAYLGVRGQTYSPAWASALGFEKNARGAYVADVVPDGPAGRAGLRGASRDTDIILDVSMNGAIYLQSGGDLITAIDGQKVTTFDDVLVYLESYKSPGEKVILTVLRSGGRQAEITVTLSARPSSAF